MGKNNKITDHRSQITDHRSQITDHRSQITDHRSQITDHRSQITDAVIIGGGFYGAAIAVYLAKERGFKDIILIEQESRLLTRASYHNQARVHNGYHYPRSFTTAYRSRVNLPLFVRDWPNALKRDFTKIYAIARRNSKVTARQFERFCTEIGAKFSPLTESAIFESQLIEKAYLVEEYVFDATKLAVWATHELQAYNVKVCYQSKVNAVTLSTGQNLQVTVENKQGLEESLTARYVFNCTYSGLNQIAGDFPQIRTGLKHEITEMALIDLPVELKDKGITVMDGPFFSVMPFPAAGDLHTLSHVRYTPHYSWLDERGKNPYQALSEYEKQTRVERMLRDAARYIPCIRNAKYKDSLFEVKTVLIKNEGDDGRPILFEQHPEPFQNCYSVLGGKIDNIYDVLERLNDESFSLQY